MNKKEYEAANKKIAVLAKKGDKTREEIEHAIGLVYAVEKYEIKKRNRKKKNK